MTAPRTKTILFHRHAPKLCGQEAPERSDHYTTYSHRDMWTQQDCRDPSEGNNIRFRHENWWSHFPDNTLSPLMSKNQIIKIRESRQSRHHERTKPLIFRPRGTMWIKGGMQSPRWGKYFNNMPRDKINTPTNMFSIRKSRSDGLKKWISRGDKKNSNGSRIWTNSVADRILDMFNSGRGNN